MTLGEFRTKTKGISDDYNLIMSIYSEINGYENISDVDTMDVKISDDKSEVYVLN